MAFKQFLIDDQISITIYKRKSSRSLRLSVDSSGEIKVSIPAWAPYASGLAFANSRLDWIKAQKRTKTTLTEGQAIGKAHHLHFVPTKSDLVTSRIINGEIRINYPLGLETSDFKVQRIATVASIRALRLQAKQLLPQRLAELAKLHNYNYHQVSIKRLKSRWGSCDHQGNIILNLYLMQLPWEYIDYVIIHELVHTKIMRHGPNFWQTMKLELPSVDDLKRKIRTYQPILDSSADSIVA